MVYVKRLELSHFKSFGGTTQIPLLPGFTVVSGPNGSGKSNILDALLFCLGISSSKGMRAERLPDLVNYNQTHRGAVETSVTVTFDLGDGEWSVTRKLRVSKQGTYASTYYINGSTCTLTELHEQLNELRIYPEGYNVVLQGDVTGIISMNSRERREIIDELAGVAAFDRKIVQTKQTLEEVKDREDSCRIVERELILQRDRLSADRIKAEKYQKLRAQLQEKEQWAIVLKWRSLLEQESITRQQIATGDTHLAQLTTQLTNLTAEIQQATANLDQLNALVKSLGEEQLLALQSHLATQSAEQRQLQRQQEDLELAQNHTTSLIQQTQLESQQHQLSLNQLILEQQTIQTEISSLRAARDEAQQALEQSRELSQALASASATWVQQQTTLNRQMETLLQTIEPARLELAQLRERHTQLAQKIADIQQLLQVLEAEIAAKQTNTGDFDKQLTAYSQQISSLAQSLATAEQEMLLQQETQKRLLLEQRDLQRQLDKLEAQSFAQQEAQGTLATKVILQAKLPGICGLVAQLGKVEPRYQLALETAAGGRLGNLVVEDDAIAAAAIELLKQKQAGRATFLPLNKIKPPRFSPTVALRYANGFTDYAVNLIECDSCYRDVFAYVFGSTVVFETLETARRYLGEYRIVTIDGELLETSGAMTGGSSSQRSSLRFGTSDAAESAEGVALKNRLQDIELILARCGEIINSVSATIKELGENLTEAKANRRETSLHLEQLQKEIKSLTAQQEQALLALAKNTDELNSATARLQVLDIELPIQENVMQQYRQSLAELEKSQIHSEWQQIQATIREREAQHARREIAYNTAEQRLKDLENQQQRLEEKIHQCHQSVAEYQRQNTQKSHQLTALKNQEGEITTKIAQSQGELTELEEKLGEEKQARDRAEEKRSKCDRAKQQLEWQVEKLQETQQAKHLELAALLISLQAQVAELPSPLPDVPVLVDARAPEIETNLGAIAFGSFAAQLEQVQSALRDMQKRRAAMEPVNMLAISEYDRTNTRLLELSEKLSTLEADRTELLLRIENFTTLRRSAFKEAFDAVNQNFQTIFAELSEGDGYLQLEDPQDPFNGGLNVVAHPKGKPVQRLASMSGGEKSLCALSFIFALQRYRPSPFYAFDEVDMFLDGANVERLARMIKKQAQQAQFIVVSLRRPMIESSERTIGVTQARGAYTQVLGLKTQSPKASV